MEGIIFWISGSFEKSWFVKEEKESNRKGALKKAGYKEIKKWSHCHVTIYWGYHKLMSQKRLVRAADAACPCLSLHMNSSR